MVYFSPDHDPSVPTKKKRQFEDDEKQTVAKPYLDCWDCTKDADCPNAVILKGGIKAQCIVCGESGVIGPGLGMKLRRDLDCELKGTIVHMYVIGCPECKQVGPFVTIHVKEVKQE